MARYTRALIFERREWHIPNRPRGPAAPGTVVPAERIYTFWDYLRNAWGRDAGLRIDHLLLSPALAGDLAAAEVDRAVRGWDKAGDHAPVWIELTAPKRRREQPRAPSVRR